jgi:hypothetical protein
METTDTETTVHIIPVEGDPDALYRHYSGQTKPQDCYISLDLRDGEMRADYNAEIGNAVPDYVWHGLVQRFTIPTLQPATVNALMESLVPLAQRVVNGTEIVWDGSNHVARLTPDADQASAEIDFTCSQEISDVYVWDAADWFAMARDDIEARFKDGATLKEVMAEYTDGDGSEEDNPVVEGYEDYLAALKAEVDAENA